VHSNASGLVEVDFKLSDVEFTLVDISGQRTQRRKWIHCFDNISTVIFCASLAEYDMTCPVREEEEDETEGEEKTGAEEFPQGAVLDRMEESLALFERTINASWWASNSSFVLLLNKSDVFEKKLQNTPLSSCFRDYEDEPTFDAGVRFIESKFMERNKSGRPIYTHVTCAVNSENVQFVFGSVRETVLSTSSF